MVVDELLMSRISPRHIQGHIYKLQESSLTRSLKRIAILRGLSKPAILTTLATTTLEIQRSFIAVGIEMLDITHRG